MPNTTPIFRSADLAHTVLLQDVAAGRRVLWIGDASTGGAERLAEVALDLRVLDTSGRRIGGRLGAARVAPFAPGPIDVDGRFDVVVVADWEVLDDLRARAGEIKDAVGDGLLVLGASALAASHDTVRSTLDQVFREVRLLGQAPFSASAFADLSEPARNAAVDGSLLGADPAAIGRYVFLAGDELPESDGLLEPAAEQGLLPDGVSRSACCPAGYDVFLGRGWMWARAPVL